MKLGIDIGGSHIAVGLIDNENKIIKMKSKELTKEEKNKTSDIIEDVLLEMINKLLIEQEIKQNKIEKIGVAVPGNVNKKGEIYTANLNLKNYPLKEILEKHYKTKIQIRNDAKCASLAEKNFGNLKNYKDAIYMCLGTGIGGGIFLNNQLLTSNSTEAFEIGHMIIKKDGIKCNCGKNGCFEKYAAISVFKEKIKKLFNIETDSGEEILKLVLKEKDNIKLEKIIEEYIDNLAIGIINLIEIFEPEAICIGGSFVYFKDIFLERLKEKVKNYPHLNPRNPKIVLAKMQNNSGILGSVLS